MTIQRKDSFIFYRSFWEAIKDITPEYRQEIVEAIIKYALDEEAPEEMTPICKGCFVLIKPQLNNQKDLEFKDIEISKYHWNWKGGISKLNARIRNSIQYKKWRRAVFERDNFTCQDCEQKGGVLNADHIKPFALFPELRFVISNGKTLCKDCHRKTETYGGRTR